MIFRSRFPEPFIPSRELSAFVLAGTGDYPGRAALIDAASGRRLSYGDYEFVEAIPRTSSGKIIRRELTERERASAR